eukprot:CAMPEP_0176202614 /NCGR_PEP_ID=MMETSP0121_2-20121125/10162_1 /TAXON_ID=160619 /ORGANISM="Kryptoperidinium foliaceum, Strain CCMP 1326" /LENGTH=58 /DNA_ID=CAMNT_0017541507 /DNA_START=17 /DNA_END=189 /DNA_ORIENTATION=+
MSATPRRRSAEGAAPRLCRRPTLARAARATGVCNAATAHKPSFATNRRAPTATSALRA